MNNTLLVQAINAFNKDCPTGCHAKPIRLDIYGVIQVEGWPSSLHYEFRLDRRENLLYIELHIENNNLIKLKETFKSIAEDVHNIQGHKIDYAEKRSNKVNPSLRIAHGPFASDGIRSAEIMHDFINKTRNSITEALTRR